VLWPPPPPGFPLIAAPASAPPDLETREKPNRPICPSAAFSAAPLTRPSTRCHADFAVRACCPTSTPILTFLWLCSAVPRCCIPTTPSAARRPLWTENILTPLAPYGIPSLLQGTEYRNTRTHIPRTPRIPHTPRSAAPAQLLAARQSWLRVTLSLPRVRPWPWLTRVPCFCNPGQHRMRVPPASAPFADLPSPTPRCSALRLPTITLYFPLAAETTGPTM